MAQYQIYRLTGGGTIVSGSFVNCSTDEEARRRAMSMAAPDGQAEVWLGTRCVGRVCALADAAFVAPGGPERSAPLGRSTYL